ncbi:LOW QUALITY PROTEIN: hypothetical protein YC2023_005004 [Brassica napus]
MEGSNLKKFPSLLFFLETNLWNSPPLTIKATRNELGLDCVLNHARVRVSINVLNPLEMTQFIHLPSGEIKEVNFKYKMILAYEKPEGILNIWESLKTIFYLDWKRDRRNMKKDEGIKPLRTRLTDSPLSSTEKIWKNYTFTEFSKEKTPSGYKQQSINVFKGFETFDDTSNSKGRKEFLGDCKCSS